MRLPRPLALALAVLCACGGARPTGNPPAPTPELAGETVSWGPWKVVVPAGLTHATGTLQASGTDYLEVTNQAGTCQIWFWPLVDAGPSLDDQALALLQWGFGSVAGRFLADPLTDNGHRRGVTGQGYPTVELYGETLDTLGGRSGHHVRVLAYGLGTQVAFTLGFENDASAGCLTESINPLAWTTLAYTVSFPSAPAPANPHALKDQLVGGWFGSDLHQTYNLAWSDVFAANGQHSDLLGVETYRQISPTEVLDTLSGWHGNGAWTASGNTLTVWPDDASKPVRTRYFRIMSEYAPTEPGGWRTTLYRLDSCAGVLCELWSVKEPR